MTPERLMTMTSAELAEWILNPTTRPIRDRHPYAHQAYVRDWYSRHSRKTGTSFRLVMPRK